MRLALRPLYTLPARDHCAVVIRLPLGHAVDLVFFDGGGYTRSVCVWTRRGHTVHFVVAGDA